MYQQQENKIMNVYVVWSFDGPMMTTLLQFDDDDAQRQAMQSWSSIDYVRQAFDVEFGVEEPNAIENHRSYELAAIFEAKDIHWIY
jgi:hypothetical protein